jgi:hypothetical protein
MKLGDEISNYVADRPPRRADTPDSKPVSGVESCALAATRVGNVVRVVRGCDTSDASGAKRDKSIEYASKRRRTVTPQTPNKRKNEIH